jgi:hypothetical protein
MRQSWSVLRHDKELMVFPILSFLACLVVLASFIVPAFVFIPGVADFFAEGRNGGERGELQPLVYAGLLLFYFVNYFVVVFFNTALVSCALFRFNGGNPTVADGLRAAASRLPQIAAWALLAATVGMILRAIEEKVDFVGKLVVSLIGLAWTVVTFLVVPVLAVEKLGPIAAVRRSTDLLRRSWGENLAGQFSLSAVGFLLGLPGILVVVLAGFLAAKTGSLVLALSIGGLGALYLIALSIATSTIQQVFLAGLYLYAAQGKVPAGFSEDVMKSAFLQKAK